MLYPKNADKKIDPALFKNPSAEYRCTPFWAWNCDLKKDELLEEIRYMKQMGMGGFHMHTRVGMSTRYLSDEYMALIRACANEAEKEKMLAWLYDEDKWPSGFAGGYVTQKKENRLKFLLLTTTPYEKSVQGEMLKSWSGRVCRANNGTLLCRYDVGLDEDGYLSTYRRLDEGQAAEHTEWFCYLETQPESPWFNYQTYVDTLSKSAIDDFIHTTHDRYKECIGEKFGKSVPAIFTDEPQVTRKLLLHRAKDTDRDLFLPFTVDLEESYQAAYDESLLDKLPEVIWNLRDGLSKTRYRYHDHVTERFVRAFGDNIGAWCDKNGIALTGHMMEEPTLQSQTAAIGEAMRAYRSFTLPGVDMLCDRHEFTTVKQAAGAAHQYGREGVTSELYGVTNWDFDFRGHKLQGDWQAALGVSVRVPHLYWVSMKGEAKRDYPASIGHQSAWYTEYSFIEDHFSRVNTLMTRGKADIKIGVIHPIESFWVHFGPNDQSGDIKAELDANFSNITEWMLRDCLDFDFICESTLPSLYREGERGFTVGEMTYDAILVPGCVTLRSSTFDRLKAFAEHGGRVIFAGEAPHYLDAEKSDKCVAFAADKTVSFTKNGVLSALEPYRKVKICTAEGTKTDDLFAALRRDGEDLNLFVCRCQNSNRGTLHNDRTDTVMIRGEYTATLFDTISGDISPLAADYRNGWTCLRWQHNDHDSLLVQMHPGRATCAPTAMPRFESAGYVNEPVPYTLAEPNVCVLDQACWKLDDGAWQPREESIQIALLAKQALHFPLSTADAAQPWAVKQTPCRNRITLRYTFFSDIEIPHAQLALEDAAISTVAFNGQQVDLTPKGWYVDRAITRVSLPTVQKGENTLQIQLPFGTVSNIENVFLLGDFGVSVIGTGVRITKAPEKLYFCDLTRQGLPFYGGKITYHLSLNADQNTALELGTYAAGCVTASVGAKRQNISLAPYRFYPLAEQQEQTTVDIEVYLSRINTFGQLHLNDAERDWFGRTSFRHNDDKTYCPEYHLKPTGLLSAPRITVKK